METRPVKLYELENLSDNEPTKYNFFNNLRRNEKLQLIDFSHSDSRKYIFQGNSRSKINSKWI